MAVRLEDYGSTGRNSMYLVTPEEGCNNSSETLIRMYSTNTLTEPPNFA